MTPEGCQMENKSIIKFKNDLSKILEDKQDLIQQILQSMDENRIIHYSEPGEISLLSTSGRILFTIIVEPEITQRALSVYLGISETMVEKTIKTLTEQGLITKTKVNRKNVYKLNKKLLIKHADIQRFPLMFNKMLEAEWD
jgi:DNA-binding MarR family transcriptional regulator